jgi:hypothetical protein
MWRELFKDGDCTKLCKNVGGIHRNPLFFKKAGEKDATLIHLSPQTGTPVNQWILQMFWTML